MIKVYSYLGKGIRETNEDYIKSEILSDSISLHVVADGMGGYEHGEEASKTATEAIFEFFAENTIEGDIPALIQQAIKFANNQILTLRNQYHSKLGTTIAGVLIIDNTAYAFWLGDVQIQHFRDGKQLFISESHTLINEMKINGKISIKDINRFKHIVSKSLSGSPIDKQMPIIEFQLYQGDNIVICSDGLYALINPIQLANDLILGIDERMQLFEKQAKDNFSIIILLK